ncbi:hypothetical protein [Clostridium beijerinckii]|uniref:hypothetical protein n=1 Tax=Clostridium beijerinckii TaxID=1520 RepID=UPI00163AB682|nr:hypothetical protein [Clostridium beijerinckii]
MQNLKAPLQAITLLLSSAISLSLASDFKAAPSSQKLMFFSSILLTLNSEIKFRSGKSQYVIPFRFALWHYIDTFLSNCSKCGKRLKGCALKPKINVFIFNKEC